MNITTKVEHYHSTLSLVRAVRHMDGGPRALLFIALDEQGHIHLARAERPEDVAQLKVGQKLSLPWTFAGRFFYFDAIHPLGQTQSIVNGDRRIGTLATLVDVAALVSALVEKSGDSSVFFGCTPHQPGSWWVDDERHIALHDRGIVDIVPVKKAGNAIIGRRTVDNGLFYLSREDAVERRFERWQRVYSSPLGNILMLERRVAHDGRLVVSCEGGLIELDIGDVPRVREIDRLPSTHGYAVVGRVTGGGFTVARGIPRDWGLERIGPATIIGAAGEQLSELRELVTAAAV